MNEFFSLQIRPWGLLTAFGFLAGLGTIAGFFGQYAWWMDLGSHFRAQYAVFFALLTACYALGKKNRWAFGALCLAFVNAVPVAMFLLPRATAEPASSASFRAMLINVNTERGSPSRVIASVTSENPDIVVLEEISDKWVEALGSIPEGYTVRTIQTRDDNFGIGLLSRIPCASTQVVYIGDADVPSIIAEVMLGDRTFVLIATHPLPPGGPNYSSYRNEQLDEVARKVATIQEPVLLLGDLNVTPWSYYYRRFMKTSGLKDSARGRSITPTWPTFCPLLWVQIDHCFHSDEIVISARRVGKNVGSDHYPLIVDFALNTTKDK
jgi:endonuclease/exonuclease/phosphatase (EEP) superfamily protein YafD